MNTVCYLLSSTVEKHSAKTAVIEGEIRITYSELYSTVESLSSFLLSHGVKRGNRVAIFLPNSIEFITSFFAVATIGAISVPINTSYKEEEIKFYISHSSSKLVLTEEKLKPIAEKAAKGTSATIIIIKGDIKDWSFSKRDVSCQNKAEIKTDDEVIYLYSTGSTGKPKRVARTHFNLIALADNHSQTVNWTEEDRILFSVPFSHTYGFGNFISAVKVGASIYSLAEFNRNKVIDLIEREYITVFPTVPFMLSALAETFLSKPRNLSSLKLVISAGAPLPKETSYKFHNKFGIYPRQLYGSTETGVISINLSNDIESKLDSVGRPVKNVKVVIFKEDGSRGEINEIGEIAVKCPSMTTGYHGLPEETKMAFKNGYYFTGDLGRIDEEGYIYIVGRKKLFINISGNKVDPSEVETLLLQHPKVREAAILGVKDRQGNEMVKAVIVSKSHMETKEVYEFFKGRISDFKIPRIIEFREEIPKSPTGKVLREYLK
ncbi:MAG: acyl--CoA ligase [Deltaproteobacteria bacterium]|nr:acyl--CoA ligase [Deltaproteobacteria bacterium]